MFWFLFDASNCIVSYHSHNLRAIKLHCNCAWVVITPMLHWFCPFFLAHTRFHILLLRWIFNPQQGVQLAQFPHNQIYHTSCWWSFFSLLFWFDSRDFLIHVQCDSYTEIDARQLPCWDKQCKRTEKDVTENGFAQYTRNSHAMNNE